MANPAILQPTVEAIRCVGQVLRVHAPQVSTPRQAGQLEVRDAQAMPPYAAPTAKPNDAMRQLASRLADISTAAKNLADAAKDGLFRDMDADLIAAIVEVFEEAEAHLATQKNTYEFTQNELGRQQRSQSARNPRDDVMECFEDAIDALQGAVWAVLIADGVDAPPGKRVFTNGRELVDATLAE